MPLDRSSTSRRRAGKRLPSLVAGAAVFLSACGASTNSPSPTAERAGSALASAAACPETAALGPPFQQPVDAAQPNDALLAQALVQLVNVARCQQGQDPLQLSPRAIQAAGEHARVMAKHDFMGHVSPVRGQETLPDRLHAARADFGYAAENVARAAVTQLTQRQGCFADASAVGAPTYGELARGLFEMWIASPVHRQNILGPNYDVFGAGVGVNPAKYRCGEIASAAVFTG